MWNLVDETEGLTFDDVLIKPNQSSIVSRKSIDISWKLGDFKFDIPVISSNMTTVTEIDMALQMADLGGLGIIHRFMPAELQLEQTEFFKSLNHSAPVCHSVGSMLNDKKRIRFLIDNKAADILCVDIAHGNNTAHMEPTLKFIRDLGFEGPIIAGNTAGVASANNLINWGADMVKIGIGPGSVCTTRIKTGVGIPQLTAIGQNSYNSHIPEGLSIPTIADGGIRYPGDAAKALGAGATAVMIGGMLAGTDCVPGWSDNHQDLLHAGNASELVKHQFQQHNFNAEGVAKHVERKPIGSTAQVIRDICEGIRSAMSYVGAHTLKEFYEKCTFIRVTSNTVLENHPHLKG